MKTAKQIKGDNYEAFVLEKLKPEYDDIWLWKNVPECVLHKCGVVRDYAIFCKYRNLGDMGIDIVAVKNDVPYFIQCKNFSDTITLDCLAGFYQFLHENDFKTGILCYNGKLSQRVIDLSKRTTFRNIPYENEQVIIKQIPTTNVPMIHTGGKIVDNGANKIIKVDGKIDKVDMEQVGHKVTIVIENGIKMYVCEFCSLKIQHRTNYYRHKKHSCHVKIEQEKNRIRLAQEELKQNYEEIKPEYESIKAELKLVIGKLDDQKQIIDKQKDKIDKQTKLIISFLITHRKNAQTLSTPENKLYDYLLNYDNENKLGQYIEDVILMHIKKEKLEEQTDNDQNEKSKKKLMKKSDDTSDSDQDEKSKKITKKKLMKKSDDTSDSDQDEKPRKIIKKKPIKKSDSTSDSNNEKTRKK